MIQRPVVSTLVLESRPQLLTGTMRWLPSATVLDRTNTVAATWKVEYKRGDSIIGMKASKTMTPVTCAMLLVCSVPYTLQAADALWTAGSGSLPTDANPSWLFYSEPISTVTLASGFLQLDTSPAQARATYFQEFYALSIPTDFVIEARVRFVSGSSMTTGRAPTGISFFLQKGVANWLWIGADEIFVNAGTRLQKGAAASVDTNDAFHDYRIEFHGTSNGSSFDVFYDDAFKLTGSLFLDDEDQEPEIGWGDVAYEASGVAQWQSFRHNAAAVPEPSAVPLTLLGGATCVAGLRRRRRTRA